VPRLKWLPESLQDIQRLHSFLAEIDLDAARRAALCILEGADRLCEHPQMGRPMDDGRRECLLPFGGAAYVLRYRLTADGQVVVIRVWHSREHR